MPRRCKFVFHNAAFAFVVVDALIAVGRFGRPSALLCQSIADGQHQSGQRFVGAFLCLVQLRSGRDALVGYLHLLSAPVRHQFLDFGVQLRHVASGRTLKFEKLSNDLPDADFLHGQLVEWQLVAQLHQHGHFSDAVILLGKSEPSLDDAKSTEFGEVIRTFFAELLR